MCRSTWPGVRPVVVREMGRTFGFATIDARTFHGRRAAALIGTYDVGSPGGRGTASCRDPMNRHVSLLRSLTHRRSVEHSGATVCESVRGSRPPRGIHVT